MLWPRHAIICFCQILNLASNEDRHPRRVVVGTGRVSHNTLFLASPHLCFIIVFICDLFVSCDDPLMG